MKPKNVCIFCASSNNIDSLYFDIARKIGIKCIENDFGLVYGGGAQGLMGQVAQTIAQAGGYITSIVPKKLQQNNIIFNRSNELIITKTMFERKSIMIEKSDAFICLPGGFGTLDEMLEVITLKQLGYIDKPIAILNTNGFYDNMINQFKLSFNRGFINTKYKNIYFVSSSIDEIFDYINSTCFLPH